MYQLVVFEPGEPVPIAKIAASRASDVLTLIPLLLAEHAGCERIEVSLDGSRLFAVDCSGNKVA